MIVGYARVSTNDQNPELQVDALEKAGAEQIFQEKFTGTLKERPELSQCLRTLRKGDVLVVWKLDRLARSLKDLVEIVQGLHDRGVGFKSLTESIVNIPILVASLIRVFRPLVFRQVFPWRQVFQ